jgi:FkbM family methyltransferase
VRLRAEAHLSQGDLPPPPRSGFDFFYTIFIDTFFFHVMLNDNYDKKIVNLFEADMTEGPYGYTDGEFDVRVKEGDTVIDAGSYIGDFAAYAAAHGAYTYAFEPTDAIFELLKKTAGLNNNKIFPVKKGLGNIDGDIEMFLNYQHPTGNKVITNSVNRKPDNTAVISITTLDNFAACNGLKKIDFIKADIEGAERDMLCGAKNILKEFSPKLAVCTYHLPDDPEVLESIIMEANPRYRVRQGPKKLYACVTNK